MLISDLKRFIWYADEIIKVLDSTNPLTLEALDRTLQEIRDKLTADVMNYLIGGNPNAAHSAAVNFSIFNGTGLTQRQFIETYGSIQKLTAKLESLSTKLSEENFQLDEAGQIVDVLHDLEGFSVSLVDLSEPHNVSEVLNIVSNIQRYLIKLRDLKQRLALIAYLTGLIAEPQATPADYESLDLVLDTGVGAKAVDIIKFFEFFRDLYELYAETDGVDINEKPLVVSRLHIGSVSATLAGLGKIISSIRKVMKEAKPTTVDDLIKAIEEERKIRADVAAKAMPEKDARELIARLRYSSKPLFEYGLDVDGISFSEAQPEQKLLGPGPEVLALPAPKEVSAGDDNGDAAGESKDEASSEQDKSQENSNADGGQSGAEAPEYIDPSNSA